MSKLKRWGIWFSEETVEGGVALMSTTPPDLEAALAELRAHVTVLRSLMPEPHGAKWGSLWNALRNVEQVLDKAGSP